MLLSKRKRSRDRESVQVELVGSKVDRRHTVKYLGVWIDDNLTWKDHIKYTLKQLHLSLQVLPYMDYCCAAWSECARSLSARLEQLQNYTTRLICCKPPRY